MGNTFVQIEGRGARRLFSIHYGRRYSSQRVYWNSEFAHVQPSGEEGGGYDQGISRTSSRNIYTPRNSTSRTLESAAAISALDVQHNETREREASSGEQEEASTHTHSKPSRIHILGTGKEGKFVAHSLASLGGRPPISLLLQRPSLVKQWYEEGQILELLQAKESMVQIGFDIENPNLTQAEYTQGRMLSTKNVLFGQDGWNIDQLIVTTEAPVTVRSLLPIKDRLHSTSTILFLQNGMGVIDEVNDKVFPNPATRPRYIEGMISHSLRNHPARTFTTLHSGQGEIFVSAQEDDQMSPDAVGMIDSTRSLLRSLARSPALNAKGVPPEELLVLKLERLAVEAVIGPLSVMFDCKNGDLLSNYNVSLLLREVLNEISMVASALPELEGLSGLSYRLHPRKIERTFVQVATKTRTEIHDMVRSVRLGKKSEVGYFTGYILKRAAELGIDCPNNTLMERMVKAKTAMRSQEASGHIPYKNDRRF
ncbi:hypothetical protein V502_03016 [Pseudogymnoascus sp. VKM F-4520 (FW-2644)]|nr:hypothetical protein V502_03016 [Pseudogymnoascus sp. VKM F-4520 (FW-2644)]